MAITSERRKTVGNGADPDGGAIVTETAPAVKHESREKSAPADSAGEHRQNRRRKQKRRQAHGSAWHWKQTDCWYYTLPGTKKRMPLFDEDGKRICGVESKKAAQLALARLQLAGDWQAAAERPAAPEEWLVAKVCSEYLQYCKRGEASGSISKGHHENSRWILNELCKYCGALAVAELKKGHIKTWIESHPKWKSPATHRSVISVTLAPSITSRRTLKSPTL
jgi:hypothetical protein